MIKVHSARVIFCQDNGMVGGHFLHCVYRDRSLLVKLIQGMNIPLLTHGDKLLENLGRTFRVVHSPVVVLQGYPHCFCNRIQFKTV